MARLSMRTAEGVALRLDLAGAGSRFAAATLDLLIISVLLIASILVLQLLSFVDVTGLTAFVRGFMLLGSLLVIVLFQFSAALMFDGQSPGKVVLGLRVVGSDGNPATTLQLFLRSLLVLIDILPFPLPLGVIIIALTRNHQRIGDLVAGTLVVREAGKSSMPTEPWRRETWSEQSERRLALSAAAASRLDAGDLAFLREVITRQGIDPLQRRALYGRVADHYLRRLELEPQSDPRVVLKELYLFLREQRG